MSRGLPGAFATNVEQPHVTSFPLVDLDLSTGMLRICGAPHDVVYGGNTYIAARGLGSIDTITETDAEIQGLAFTLQGVTPDIIALALTDQSQGRSVVVRFATVNAGTLSVDDNVWSGLIDTLTIVDGAAPAVRVTAEHRLITWQTPQPLRFSDADQKRLFPGDTFFSQAEQAVSKQLVWPAKAFFMQ